MKNSEHGIESKESQSSDDLRENRKQSKLPCGAQYCHQCHEECGVIVNAYILRDIAADSSVTNRLGTRTAATPARGIQKFVAAISAH